MTTYATVATLCARFGYAEIAEVADDDNLEQHVDPTLFRLAVDGGDISDADPDVIRATEAAITRAEQALQSAQATVDQKLACQYDLTLITTDLAECNDLPRHTANIARFRLHKHGAPEGVKVLHDQTMTWLADVARNRAKLRGIDAGSGTSAPAGGMVSGQGVSAFDWDAHSGCLGGYGGGYQ